MTVARAKTDDGGGQFLLFTTWSCLIAAAYGGNFSLYPTAVMEEFGPVHAGANYGIVFTAFGLAGVVGTFLKQGLENDIGFPDVSFLMGGLCLAGVLAAWAFGTLPKAV